MPNKNWVTVAAFVLLCSFHLGIYSCLPEADKNGGWPSTVMRNWHEMGYWHLSGQLVANPGGVEATEPLFVYPGHRPYLLIPPFLLKELPGTLGGNGLLYDFTMVLATFAGVIYLFGANPRGWTMAVATCLAPGFIANVAHVDTISYPAVTGIAALAFIGAYLTREDGCKPRQALVFVLLLLYMVMNWSTLFSLFVMAVYVGCKKPPGKKLLLFAGAAAFLGLLVFAASVASRHSTGTTTGNFWNAYLMGPAGYDRQGMNWNTALVRLTGVNMIAWLPVLMVVPILLFCHGRGERWRWAPLPLLAAIFVVLVMRNYNAHHPWGATSIIGLGLLFSAELALAPVRSVKPAVQSAGLALGLAFSLLYALSWVSLDEFNHRDENAIYNLLTRHTPRHGLIVITDNFLPAGQLDASRLGDQYDRRMVSLSDWNHDSARYAVPGRECFLMTHDILPQTGTGPRLVTHSVSQPRWADKIMTSVFDFYRSKISRRSKGDRLVLFDEYQLYKY